MRVCSAPPEPRPGHHGSNRTTPPGPTSNVPSPRSPPRTGAGSSYATSAPPPTTPGYTPAAPRSTYALCSGTALPARTGPGRSPETPRQAPRHGLHRPPTAHTGRRGRDPVRSRPISRPRAAQPTPPNQGCSVASQGGSASDRRGVGGCSGVTGTGWFILQTVETDPGGDRCDISGAGSGCDNPAGGDGRRYGGRSRHAGHLLSGPAVPERVRGQAADPGRGGLLPARPSGSADRVAGVVRADRGEVPSGYEGLGAGQLGAGGAGQVRGSQGRHDAPLPGAGCRR